ncbi:carbamoyltransferase HypF [Streptosporangium carneum]|uniref:Carbamoyltransferase n=1 Tax=Streptosporangium carneum TaxID=47481 RepID=A0A9W6IAG1_9ACTN|nr:carbamoyltransferase HypF [Streptosporangium carneum]GLK13850.1 carbamoyltransferase [Streptosporangium carneum]
MRVRSAIRVEGIVQGVGFRPFVYGLAVRLGLGGLVGNDERGVFIEVEGAPALVEEFTAALGGSPPPLAVIERISSRAVPATGETRFAIARSAAGGRRRALVSPDVATCADCLREMDDPADRRYGYAFTNCTNCGPRFTIVENVPYDRPNTTMAAFAMCEDCAREYHDPGDRRFHAQPVCCPACGPRLRLLDRVGGRVAGDPLQGAVELLRGGRVLAVKGLGGYHLAAVASCEPAVAALRSRKHREDKPFAVMVSDLAGARRLCEVDGAEERLLTAPSRPIVLLRRRGDADVAPSVAPGSRWLGLMLPYTPLHHLLLRRLAEPAVLTSGNVSDEPIAYLDDDAVARLGGVADAFLVHDRPIRTRTDDSVVRVFRGDVLPVRRSRGHVPHPLPLAWELPRPVLACGAELKHTFCVARGGHAFVSHHIGDLENYETFRSFTEGVGHFTRLFDVVPEVVAHDLHPEYLSTKYALAQEGVDLVAVQHHHAHVASCLADNGVAGPVIGVAFDGLGYGQDATLWGGEFLVADLTGFERAGHLATVPMPGGTAAIRQPWRMAAAYLDAAYDGAPPGDLDVVRRNAASWEAVVALGHRGVNAPLTSSMGRLFDAVATVAGGRDVINYEGQAAVEWEQRADPGETGEYGFRVTDGTPFAVSGSDLVRAVADDLRAGAEPGVVSARFHNAVARVVAEGCRRVRETSGLSTVALSGGVFQNVLLLERATTLLEDLGFHVLLHRRVPPNDGGISLGQAAVAGARDRLG